MGIRGQGIEVQRQVDMKAEIDAIGRREPSAESIAAIEQTAIKAAQQASRILLDSFRRPVLSHTRLLHDIKLETDRHCEHEIVRVIREAFPDHGILTEESGWLPGQGDAFWIVDPLDGTVNFWHGLPFFCVSVACYHAPAAGKTVLSGQMPLLDLNRPITGVVQLPCTRELFVGSAGRGAFLNGRPFHTPAVAAATEAVVSVSFGKTTQVMDRMTLRLHRLLPGVRKARCLGAAAAEICYAAAGYLGGVFYENLKPWDFAAGKIVLQEAGGFLEAVETDTGHWQVMAGTSKMRAELRSLLGL